MMYPRWAIALLLVCSGCAQLFGLDELPPSDGGSGSIRFVQSKSAANTTLGQKLVSVVLTQPPAVGDVLVVALSTYHVGSVTVSDSTLGANPYEMTPLYPVASPAAALWILTARVIATMDPFTVTVNVVPASPTEGEASIAVHEYAGLASHRPDKSASQTDAGNMVQCGTVPAVTADELMFAAMIHDGPGVSTAGQNFTLREIATDSITITSPLATEDAQRPAGSTLDASFFLSQSSGWACGAITLR